MAKDSPFSSASHGQSPRGGQSLRDGQSQRDGESQRDGQSQREAQTPLPVSPRLLRWGDETSDMLANEACCRMGARPRIALEVQTSPQLFVFLTLPLVAALVNVGLWVHGPGNRWDCIDACGRGCDPMTGQVDGEGSAPLLCGDETFRFDAARQSGSWVWNASVDLGVLDYDVLLAVGGREHVTVSGTVAAHPDADPRSVTRFHMRTGEEPGAVALAGDSPWVDWAFVRGEAIGSDTGLWSVGINATWTSAEPLDSDEIPSRVVILTQRRPYTVCDAVLRTFFLLWTVYMLAVYVMKIGTRIPLRETLPEQFWIVAMLLVTIGMVDPSFIPMLWMRGGGASEEASKAFTRLFVFLFDDLMHPFLLLLLCGVLFANRQAYWLSAGSGTKKYGVFIPGLAAAVWSLFLVVVDVVQYAGWSSGVYDAESTGTSEERAATASLFRFGRPVWLEWTERMMHLCRLTAFTVMLFAGHFVLQRQVYTVARMRILCYRAVCRCAVPYVVCLAITKIRDQYGTGNPLRLADRFSNTPLRELIMHASLFLCLAQLYKPIASPRDHSPPPPDSVGWVHWQWSNAWLWWRQEYGKSLYFFVTERERLLYFESQATQELSKEAQAHVEVMLERMQRPSCDELGHSTALQHSVSFRSTHSASRHKLKKHLRGLVQARRDAPVANVLNDSIAAPRLHRDRSVSPQGELPLLERESTLPLPRSGTGEGEGGSEGRKEPSSPDTADTDPVQRRKLQFATPAGRFGVAPLSVAAVCGSEKQSRASPGGAPMHSRFSFPTETPTALSSEPTVDFDGHDLQPAPSCGMDYGLQPAVSVDFSAVVDQVVSSDGRASDADDHHPLQSTPMQGPLPHPGSVNSGRPMARTRSVSSVRPGPRHSPSLLAADRPRGAGPLTPQGKPRKANLTLAGFASSPMARAETSPGVGLFQDRSPCWSSWRRASTGVDPLFLTSPHPLLHTQPALDHFAHTTPEDPLKMRRGSVAHLLHTGTTSARGALGPKVRRWRRRRSAHFLALPRQTTEERSGLGERRNTVYDATMRPLPRFAESHVDRGGIGAQIWSMWGGSSRPPPEPEAGAPVGESATPKPEPKSFLQADGWFCLESATECFNATMQAYRTEARWPFIDLAEAASRAKMDDGEDRAITQWFEDGSTVPCEYSDAAGVSDVWDTDVEADVLAAREELWTLSQCWTRGSEYAARRLLGLFFGIRFAEQRQGCQRVDMLIGPSFGEVAPPAAMRVWAGSGCWTALGEATPLRLPAARGAPWLAAQAGVESVADDATRHCPDDWCHSWEQLLERVSTPLSGSERLPGRFTGSMFEWWQRELRKVGATGPVDANDHCGFFRGVAFVRGLLFVVCGLPFDEETDVLIDDDDAIPALSTLAEALRQASDQGVVGCGTDVVYPHPAPGRTVRSAVSSRDLIGWIGAHVSCPRHRSLAIAEMLREDGVLRPAFDTCGTTPPPFCCDGALWRVTSAEQAYDSEAAREPAAEPARCLRPKVHAHAEPLHPEAYGYRLEAVITLPLHELRAVLLSSEARVVLSFRGTSNVENAKLDCMCCSRAGDDGDKRIFADVDQRADAWFGTGVARSERMRKLACDCGCDARRLCQRLLLKAPWDSTPSVHDGFLRGWELMEDEVLEAVRRVCPLDDPRPFYTTGHSLGGALAQVAAFFISWKLYQWQPDLTDELRRERRANGEEKMVRAYCFSSPKVGNVAFRAMYDLVVPETFVVAVRGDPVLGMPYSACTCSAWTHAGQKFLLGDVDGTASWMVEPRWFDLGVSSYNPKDPRNHLLVKVSKQLNLVVDHVCDVWPHNRCYGPAGGLFTADPEEEGDPHAEASGYLGPWIPLPADQPHDGSSSDEEGEEGEEESADEVDLRIASSRPSTPSGACPTPPIDRLPDLKGVGRVLSGRTDDSDILRRPTLPVEPSVPRCGDPFGAAVLSDGDGDMDAYRSESAV
eukprot:TRINITY_DN889_c0_g2_i1.p1 TRINITY_DN889_c0_g2~~TRINITY_DN889_c0_g2_i1.p1  ORF type:complete len:1963 (+),score=550.61 TRINITY_DN889_c0_g2_i1:44-5890(+)